MMTAIFSTLMATTSENVFVSVSEAPKVHRSEQLTQQPWPTPAVGQQEVPQSVRNGPARSLVHSVQMEESVHALR